MVQGDPSVFLTLSLDDVHQALSIRLSFPSSKRHAFPAFDDGNSHASPAGALPPPVAAPPNLPPAPQPFGAADAIDDNDDSFRGRAYSALPANAETRGASQWQP